MASGDGEPDPKPHLVIIAPPLVALFLPLLFFAMIHVRRRSSFCMDHFSACHAPLTKLVLFVCISLYCRTFLFGSVTRDASW